jgi:hypothetical protein
MKRVRASLVVAEFHFKRIRSVDLDDGANLSCSEAKCGEVFGQRDHVKQHGGASIHGLLIQRT